MNEKILRAFDGLSKVIRDLDDASDGLNEELAEVQAELRRLKCGVSVRVGEIGWGKCNDEWMLIRFKDDKTFPLLHAPRAIRVAARDALPSLIDALTERSKAMLASIEESLNGNR